MIVNGHIRGVRSQESGVQEEEDRRKKEEE
jgi:hypothetical protein